MRKTKKTWLAILFSTVIMALLLGVTAQAAVQNPFQPSKKYGGHLPSYHQRQILSSFWPKGGDFSTPGYKKDFEMKAVSANKKVATVKVETRKVGDRYRKYLYVIAKGAGKTEIQITVKIKGKTYKKTFPYQVYKYENPFSSFKVNGKNYASKLNKLKKGHKVATGSVRYASWIPPEGKLSYKLKKNYKIQWLEAVGEDGEILSGAQNNQVLPEGCKGFWIGYENTKTKAYGELFIGKK